MGSPETAEWTSFRKALKGSMAGVNRVAEWLSQMGMSVVVCGQSIAPNLSEERWSDSGDLFLLKRLEVKHLTTDFTGYEDWPHKPHFIVTSKGNFDKIPKAEKPEAYIVLNKDMTHAGVVNVKDTREDWYVQERMDAIFKNKKPFYFCPLKAVKWHTL
jgi:hypothetical protein